jgi:hypothetical protein
MIIKANVYVFKYSEKKKIRGNKNLETLNWNLLFIINLKKKYINILAENRQESKIEPSRKLKRNLIIKYIYLYSMLRFEFESNVNFYNCIGTTTCNIRFFLMKRHTVY